MHSFWNNWIVISDNVFLGKHFLASNKKFKKRSYRQLRILQAFLNFLLLVKKCLQTNFVNTKLSVVYVFFYFYLPHVHINGVSLK